MDDLETPFADNAEYLPNGIHVHRLLFDESHPWIASIRIGPWYYCQGGKTKDEAISALFEYMRRMKLGFEDSLKRDIDRLETLNKFLETEVDDESKRKCLDVDDERRCRRDCG